MPNKNMTLGSTTLPVLAECDVVVAGGSYAGCSLALELARQGRKVVIVESHTYLGWESAALLRPWMAVEALDKKAPALFQPWIKEASKPSDRPEELALHPDLVKRALEDVCLTAGVKLFYFSWALGLVWQGKEVAGLVIGNKSGRQVILAKCVVDATDSSVLGRMALPFISQPAPARHKVSRCLEFTGVAAGLQSGPDFTVHQGHLGAGHVVLDCALELELPSADFQGRMAMELEARALTFKLAMGLLKEDKHFSKAYLAATAWELKAAWPHRLDSMDSYSHPSHPNLFVLSAASYAFEPWAGARKGEALAPVVGQACMDRKAPQAGSCAALCGKPAAKRKADLEVGEFTESQRGRDWQRVAAPAQEIPVLDQAEVLVAGGGTSGATASAVAARLGARTVCIDPNSGLGGTGTVGGVDSYWYGRKVAFTADLDQRYAKRAQAMRMPAKGVWNVEGKMDALLDWNVTSGARLYFRSLAVAALKKGKTVKGVLVATPDGLKALPAQVTIDGSGDGDVAASAGAEFVYGSSRDRIPMWYSMAPLVKPGRPQNNFTSTVDVSNVEDYTRAILAARRRWDGHDHVTLLCPRESRHILGEVLLTLDDQLQLRHFPDVVNLCFSNSDIKGKSSADWLVWGFLPPNVETEIPYRALVPKKIDGMLIAGKAYSCVHDFLALARMQPDMQNQGGVCAVAAVQSLKQGVAPRKIDVARLQKTLVKEGLLSAAQVKGPAGKMEEGPRAWKKWVDSLTGKEPFFLRQGFKDITREPSVLIQIAKAPRGIVPLLVKAHAAASDGRKLLLARLLAWHGNKAGLETLAQAVEKELAGPELPLLSRNAMYVGTAPDQAVMPEVCYLLFTLGMIPDLRSVALMDTVARKYQANLEDFKDRKKGVFYYVDAVCYLAERLGRPEAAGPLLKLHEHPLLHDKSTLQPQADFMLERLAYLELAMGRSLARCGHARGYEVLMTYLGDSRAILAEHAQDELEKISGKAFGKNAQAWRQWLASRKGKLPMKPWTQRIG